MGLDIRFCPICDDMDHLPFVCKKAAEFDDMAEQVLLHHQEEGER